MAATGNEARCAHCGVLIIDPTTQRVHGSRTFCCANCAAMMEQHGPGSDPDSTRAKNDLRCAHCGSAIVDESTMESHGDSPFCCRNCKEAHVGASAGTP